jgi:glycerol-3-phosphate acyltransferase PlsY
MVLDAGWPWFLGAALLAYLLGSLPFGLLLTRAAGLGDVRRIGSGNIGATNVLRTGRKDLALATLLLDGGKGVAAVLLAWAAAGPGVALVAAVAAVVGHLWPVWLRFKGGKGVATTLGTLLALSPPVGLLCCLTWLLVALVFRYSSLAALVSLALAPVYAFLLPWGVRLDALAGAPLFQGDWHLVAAASVLAALVWTRHHQNIARLMAGEEPRIGRKKAERG